MIQKAPKMTEEHDAGRASAPPRRELRLGRVTAYAGVSHMAMARYDADGALDTSFGSGYGFVTTDFGAWASCGSVLVDGGKIVAGGQAAGSMAFVRYDSNGTLDNDFNGDGKLIVPMGSSSSVGRMALDSQGRIVAAGWARPAGFTFGLVRLRINPANGTLDGTFGEGGTLITDVYNNWGGGMTIQGDGDIVVVGSVSGGAFLTARYKGTGQQRLYYQQDANWNVTALVSADDASESYTGGVVVERYLTDPYGNVVTLTGNWGGRISDSSGLSYYGNPYGFQGGRRDVISGLITFEHREYSCALGRWVEPDPTGYVDGMSLYQADRTNPETYVDFMGTDAGFLGALGATEHVSIAVDVWSRCEENTKAGLLVVDFHGEGWMGSRQKAGIWKQIKAVGLVPGVGVPGELDWKYISAARGLDSWMLYPVLRRRSGTADNDMKLVNILAVLTGIDKQSGSGKTWLQMLIDGENATYPNNNPALRRGIRITWLEVRSAGTLLGK